MKITQPIIALLSAVMLSTLTAYGLGAVGSVKSGGAELPQAEIPMSDSSRLMDGFRAALWLNLSDEQIESMGSVGDNLRRSRSSWPVKAEDDLYLELAGSLGKGSLAVWESYWQTTAPGHMDLIWIEDDVLSQMPLQSARRTEVQQLQREVSRRLSRLEYVFAAGERRRFSHELKLINRYRRMEMTRLLGAETFEAYRHQFTARLIPTQIAAPR